ncbi:DUF6113 family protein [Streptomyces telluris]|uniref:DUF6113 family protein n=1 Tax=Streptomyces telluris TaxID=2720021 RepID=A0A9X2LFD9_9ACTN|nr:DUF6113 family protein [Streptomyces telluris]MCQ8770256.1 DUF6113 family protein [Streptomyces telluris]NJP75828.1 hypothetical protein [Streptomyces telluris]
MTGMTAPLSAGRIAAFAGLFVLGAATGFAGALTQGGWFPGGLSLALLAVAGLSYGAVTATGSRAGGAVAGGGWLVAVLLMTSSRPEGDFFFGAGIGAYVFLLGGMALAVMCATVPKLPQPDGPSVRLGK